MNIAETITQPESKTLEFKRDLSSLKPILKTLVAFAKEHGWGRVSTTHKIKNKLVLDN